MIWFYVSFIGLFGVVFLKRYYWAPFFIILVLGSSFRYYVGSDFDDYVYLFENVSAGSEVPVELSFSYISLMLAKLGFNFQALILLYSVFTYFFIYLGLRNISKDNAFFGVVVILIYFVFYFPSLSIMRQALAASIVFYACFRYLFNEHWFVFLFFVLISSLFHMSGIIYLLCIPMYYFKLSKVFYIALILLAAIIGSTVWVEFLSYISSYTGLSYKGYMFTSQPIVSPIFYVFTVLLICVFFYSLKVSRKENFFLLNVVFFIIVARLLAIDYKPLNRLGAGYSIFIPLFLYQVFYLKFKSDSRVLFFVMIAPLLFVSDYFRANKDYSYYQYSINFCIYGPPCPISIYGDLPLDKLLIREELR